jgi:lysophospholipase L1-like esterase
MIKKAFIAATLLAATVTNAYAEGVLPEYPSIKPEPRVQQFPWMALSKWYRMHSEDVAVAEAGEAQVVFLGDSITEGWDPTVWQKRIAPLKAANFGIGGDMTQNLLWRMENGAVEKLDPQVVVIMIGVNNFLRYNASPQEVFTGVKAVVEKSLHDYPNAQIVLNGIFPYEQSGKHPNREKVKQANALIKNLGDYPRVEFHDFGPSLLEENGDLSREIMPDFLHPNAKGYAIWADALLPVVRHHMAE